MVGDEESRDKKSGVGDGRILYSTEDCNNWFVIGITAHGKRNIPD
jgi:hypothetical protein